jgi:hypothetical protein
MTSQMTRQLRRQLDDEKDGLTTTLQELGERVDAAADWRRQFAKRPEVMMGLALVGGAVIGGLTAPGARGTRARRSEEEALPLRSSRARPRGAPILQRTAAAVMSLAAGRAVAIAESIIGDWADELLRPRARRSGVRDANDA